MTAKQQYAPEEQNTFMIYMATLNKLMLCLYFKNVGIILPTASLVVIKKRVLFLNESRQSSSDADIQDCT